MHCRACRVQLRSPLTKRVGMCVRCLASLPKQLREGVMSDPLASNFPGVHEEAFDEALKRLWKARQRA